MPGPSQRCWRWGVLARVCRLSHSNQTTAACVSMTQKRGGSEVSSCLPCLCHITCIRVSRCRVGFITPSCSSVAQAVWLALGVFYRESSMCVGESLAGKVWIVSHSLCDVTLYLAGGYRQRNSSSHTNLTQNSEVQDLYSRAAGTATEFVSLLELTYL